LVYFALEGTIPAMAGVIVDGKAQTTTAIMPDSLHRDNML
jgi:hypothetical protein